MYTQYMPEVAHQRHMDLLREAEHVRLMRSLKPQRNGLARRLAQAMNWVVMLAHFRLSLRNLETA